MGFGLPGRGLLRLHGAGPGQRETWGIPDSVIKGVYILLFVEFFLTLVLA